MSIHTQIKFVSKSLISLNVAAVLSISATAHAQTSLDATDSISFAGDDVCLPNFVELPKNLQEAEAGNPDYLPTIIEGDRIEITQDGRRLLKGNVSVEQGRRGIYADNLAYDESKYLATADGNVRFYTENGDLLTSESLNFEVDTFIGTANGAKFELAEKYSEDDDDRNHNRFKEDYSPFAPWTNAYDAQTIAQMQADEEAQEAAQKEEESGEAAPKLPKFAVSGRGAAAQMNFAGLDFMTLKDAQFTTCPRGNEDVVISASELELDQVEGIGRAKNATVRFKNVPIFYFPRVSFPINDERKTGFLFPTAGYDSRSGFFAEVPYYWNIAPQYDATFVARSFSERGVQVGAEFRHLTAAGGQGQLRGEFLPSDSYEGEDENDVNEFEGEDRYAFGYDFEQNLGNNWKVDIDLQTVSDVDYLRDFDNNLDIVASSFIPQRATLRHFSSDFKFVGEVKAYEVVSDDIVDRAKPYDKLPSIEFDIRPQELGIFELGLESRYEVFSHDSDTRDTGSRLNVKPYIELPLEEIYGYVKPKFSLETIRYSVDRGIVEENTTTQMTVGDMMDGVQGDMLTEDVDTDPTITNVPVGGAESVTVPIFSVDSGLYFERLIEDEEKTFVQTLEPRLFFVNIPEELDQEDFPLFDTNETNISSYNQLFQENRFTGNDRIGDTQQITLGLSTRLIDDEEGEEKFKFSLGQALYLKDREVGLTTDSDAQTSSVSDLIAEATATVNEDWRLTGFTRWDEEEGDLGTFRLTANYDHSSRRSASFSFIENLDADSQLNLSLKTPIASHWQFDSSVNYSIEDSEVRSSEFALSYDSCCWAIKTGLQRYLVDANEYSNRIIFTLELDHLGSITNRSSRF